MTTAETLIKPPLNTLSEKRNKLFIILCGIFITNALLAEMIGVKIFSAESTLGVNPLHLNILGFAMDFNLTAGVIIWPIVFITTDLINEYFGKPGVKTVTYFAAALILYAFIIIYITMKLAPATVWMDANNADNSGNAFNIDYAYNKIFGQGLRIIFASLAAFLVGQLIDVFVFQRIRKLTGPKMLWLRATGSTVVSQFVDSFVVLFIAFYGMFDAKQIIAIGITNYIYKFIVAVLLTPLIYIGHKLIDQYMGKEYATQMTEEASKKSEAVF